jgi:hypothetical protein
LSHYELKPALFCTVLQPQHTRCLAQFLPNFTAIFVATIIVILHLSSHLRRTSRASSMTHMLTVFLSQDFAISDQAAGWPHQPFKPCFETPNPE